MTEPNTRAERRDAVELTHTLLRFRWRWKAAPGPSVKTLFLLLKDFSSSIGLHFLAIMMTVTSRSGPVNLGRDRVATLLQGLVHRDVALGLEPSPAFA